MEKRILLVDDEVMYQKLYSEALTQAEYTVDVAKDGEQAKKLLKKNKYDLLIVDLIMPIMSGMKFIKSLKGRKPKIIVLTTLEGETDREDALKAGAKSFLIKSQTPPEILVHKTQQQLE